MITDKRFKMFCPRGHFRSEDNVSKKTGNCKTCVRQRLKEWALNNPEKAKKSELKARHNFKLKHYGITPLQYNDLLTKQGFRCAICRTHQSELKHQLQIDHCHQTNNVRGLLCRLCNINVGKYEKHKAMAEKYINEFKRDNPCC